MRLSPPGALPRRVLLPGLIAWSGPSRAAGPVPDSGRLGFRVLREGVPLGTHQFVFTLGPDDSLTVAVSVGITAGVGPLTFYRFSHTITERWSRGAFVSLDAETDDNGVRHVVRARRGSEGVTVAADSAPPRVLPAATLPVTHWNRRILSGPMFNTQTGELMRPTVISLGFEAVATASGATVRGEHLSLRGEPGIDTWYDDAPSWLGMRVIAKDGSEVRYERL